MESFTQSLNDPDVIECETLMGEVLCRYPRHIVYAAIASLIGYQQRGLTDAQNKMFNEQLIETINKVRDYEIRQLKNDRH